MGVGVGGGGGGTVTVCNDPGLRLAAFNPAPKSVQPLAVPPHPPPHHALTVIIVVRAILCYGPWCGAAYSYRT